ncbi:MAG: hypothetical protein M3R27_04800 [Bacteroidota bacterium]|nr:hypothetical protein [Bacteroidota bacterium]
MKHLFLVVLLIGILSSCKNKNAATELVFTNDAEPKEWIGNMTIKDSPFAHSGVSASITDSLHPYSLGLRKQLKEINGGKVTKATFSFWVYFKTPNCSANCVLSIDGQEKNYFWIGTTLNQKVREYNKWIEVVETFLLPTNTDPSHTLSLYVWNVSKEEVLVDDLKISFN